MSIHVEEDPILGKTYDARLIRRLIGYVRPYQGPVALAIALLLAASLASTRASLPTTAPSSKRLPVGRCRSWSARSSTRSTPTTS